MKHVKQRLRWYNYYTKVFNVCPFIFYHCPIKSNTYKFNNIIVKVVLKVSYVRWVNVIKMSLQAKDLMKLQQGLIDNNNSGLRKMMSYFIRTYEQYTQGHAKIQHKIMYI
jgi:hypothetical protein